ncbi:ArsR family transcriptional regulator (plasmid) [Streptantibioticus cattleyicolor NRRL 8057 = DSM 46488]|uniref:ArsR family transcriptional regulator n=1 Tax=Streptantibioticus cattleyicolor (strain ATCC 35852 / DSM 46488 / JCM 4925 / NBRC 14057 / NRRL 8057) TaxID=1003195 RepID=F8JNH6_STREN
MSDAEVPDVRAAYANATYVAGTPEQVWRALTDPELTARYWGHANVSDWRPGSRWEHRRTDGSGVADVVGTVVESAPPHRLVTTWASPDGEAAGVPSRVTFGIQGHDGIVRLTVTHEDLADEDERAAAAAGWTAVLANLKTLVETGEPLPTEPWLMP